MDHWTIIQAANTIARSILLLALATCGSNLNDARRTEALILKQLEDQGVGTEEEKGK